MKWNEKLSISVFSSVQFPLCRFFFSGDIFELFFYVIFRVGVAGFNILMYTKKCIKSLVPPTVRAGGGERPERKVPLRMQVFFYVQKCIRHYRRFCLRLSFILGIPLNIFSTSEISHFGKLRNFAFHKNFAKWKPKYLNRQNYLSLNLFNWWNR